MHTKELNPTVCALCRSHDDGRELYSANFAITDLNPEIFSARRMPDRMHYRIVECPQCGLVRSNPTCPSDQLTALYQQGKLNYGGEILHLQKTYRRYLEQAARHAPARERMLEIGCGNGFALEMGLDIGFREARGVEPSEDAIKKAGPHIRPSITNDIMRPHLFPSASFDLVAMFQVFDHLPDPTETLSHCHDVLRSEGILLCLNHNVTSWSARLLGERSPIIDIEHTYLYGPDSLSRLLEKNRFQVVTKGMVWNTYSLNYLTHLLPLPATLKKLTMGILQKSGLGGLPIAAPLGNMMVVARRVG